MKADHALAGLDPHLSAPKRLAIMALLASTTSTDFTFVRDHLGLSDSDLSKQMSALESVGYLKSTKSGRGRGSSTTFEITKVGRRVFEQHRATLRAMLGD